MIRKFVITPHGGAINTQTLPHSYIGSDGKEKILTSTGEFTSVFVSDNNKPLAGDFTFDARHRALEISYNDDPTQQSPMDKRNEVAIEVFWKNHSLLLINGKEHAGTKMPLFDLQDQTKAQVDGYKRWEEMKDAANLVYSMSFPKKREVCFYYGTSPVGKSENELALLLADFKTGFVMQESALSDFLKVWSPGSDDERNLVVSVRKAISLNIIESRHSDNGKVSYYFGQTFIGTEFNDVLAYCKREEQIYKSSILRMIDQQDSYKEEVKKTSEMGAVLSDIKTADMGVNDIFVLREEAKRLKDEGFIDKITGVHNMTVNKLLPIVEAARIKKEEARQATLQQA